MKKPRILLSIAKRKDADLDALAARVITNMTGNTYFLNPTPNLTDLNLSHQAFSAAMTAAQTRDSMKVALKKEVKAKLVADLIQLANYVMGVANGNRPMLISSGFDVSAENSTKGVLGAIEGFTVTLGKNSGEAVVSVTVKNARFYLYYFAVAGTDPIVWEHHSSTSSTFTITGLDPLKNYIFRVKARGTKGQFVETGIITQAII